MIDCDIEHVVTIGTNNTIEKENTVITKILEKCIEIKELLTKNIENITH